MANNFCSMCGGNVTTVNYTKLVDPPARQYGTILGDAPEYESYHRRPCKSQMPSIQVCLPSTSSAPAGPSHQHCAVQNAGYHRPGQQPSIIQVPCDPVKPSPKFVCEPCPPPPPTKVWLIKSSPTPQKSVCLPVCNPPAQGNNMPTKIMVCLPCPPPTCVSPAQQQSIRHQICSFPFAVPQKIENDRTVHAGKYLPPPEKRICPQHCIHVNDIKGNRPCTWHSGIPCLAHCFDTPLRVKDVDVPPCK